MAERFKIVILKDAAEFLDKLDEKSRDKIIYNITKAKFSNDKERGNERQRTKIV